MRRPDAENREVDDPVSSGERYVYCRHGDIIDELKRIGPAPKKVPSGGTDHYLAAFLAFAGNAPTLLLAARPESSEYTVANVQAKTFRCYRRGGRQIRGYVEEAGLFFKVLLSLFSFRPTKILCAKIGPALWACFLYSRLTGAPLVHSRHTRVELLSRNPVRQLWFYIDRWILRRSKAVICHGPYLYKQLLEIGVPSERLLQYNVDYRYLLKPYPLAEESPGLPAKGERFVIFFVGRIHEDKGVFDLLEAAGPLLKEKPDLLLVYAGQGPDLEVLRRRVEGQPYASQIVLLGFVRHEQLPDLIRQAKVVVTPTRRALTEGLCSVVPESFVLERPVIAPDFGPFPYLVEDGVNGLLFRAEDIQDLRQKLRKAVEDAVCYAKLASGARDSGKRHLVPELDFPRALSCAFGGVD